MKIDEIIIMQKSQLQKYYKLIKSIMIMIIYF